MLIDTDKIILSPSVIASDLSRLGDAVASFDRDIVDLLHIDVMDGHFVPNLTFGPGYLKNLKLHTDIPLDVHCMIERPEYSVEQYIALAPWCVTIHYESTRFPARVLKTIRDAGINAGLSVNPATPVESIFDLCEYADLVLIMAVDPGFYGQPFMKSSLGRIERLAAFLKNNGLSEKVGIQVDGGISRDTIGGVVRAGARIIVAVTRRFPGAMLTSTWPG